MDPVALACLILAFFVELKAIEYKGEPGIYRACSIFSWVAIVVGMLLWFVR